MYAAGALTSDSDSKIARALLCAYQSFSAHMPARFQDFARISTDFSARFLWDSVQDFYGISVNFNRDFRGSSSEVYEISRSGGPLGIRP